MKRYNLILMLLVAAIPVLALTDKTVPTQAEIDKELQQLKANMVLVEGGSFMMGAASQDSEANANERPAHQVTLSSFYASKYEVTQGLWRAVMGQLGYYNSVRNDQLPVSNRNYAQCHEFIEKLNALTGEHYRLLTEAEWEFAARGGNQSQGYKYAGSNTLSEVADMTLSDLTLVGQKRSNELGLFDMTGNADEWVEDSYRDYTADSETNPLYKQDELYGVTRGGYFASSSEECRITYRKKQYFSFSSYYTSFRLAKDADLTPQPAKGRSFIVSYKKGGQDQQAAVAGIRFVANQYGKEAYAWQPADSAWRSYTSLAADGFDIQNVRSISRYRIELSEASGDALQKALAEEAASGTGDVNAIVAALKSNPNVADVETDDINVMVLEKNDSVYTVYQMVKLEDPFITEELMNLASRLRKEFPQQHKASSNEKKKIAIFNFFAGIDKRAGQNAIVEGIRDLFKNHGYYVEYYDNNERDFTKANIEKVVTDAHDNDAYKAVFIFSHGFYGKDHRVSTEDGKGAATNYDKAFYVTREEYNPKRNVNQSDEIDEHHYKMLFMDIGDYYNIALPVEDLKVGPNCLLYVGSCNAFNNTNILTREPWVGWTGTNTLAQAHAAVMASRMLDHNMNLVEALGGIWKSDGASSVKYNPTQTTNIKLENDPMASTKPYVNIFNIEIANPSVSGNKVLTLQKKMTEFEISGVLRVTSGDYYPYYFFMELIPLHKDGKTIGYYEFQLKTGGLFSQTIQLPKKLRGVYELHASYYADEKHKNRRYIHFNKPVYLACSDEFKANDAIVLQPAKDSKIVLTTAKEPGETLQFEYVYGEDVWFDMNNNGIRDAGEWDEGYHNEGDQLTFYPKVESQTFTIYGNLTGTFDCGVNVAKNVNRLTSIDMSEYYGDMEHLLCSNNELTKLVLPRGVPLKGIDMRHNQIKELDASALFFLEYLMAENNQLSTTTLQLPESEDLYSLDVQSNPQITALDVSEYPNLRWLFCQNCNIESLDVSHNPLLTQLLCDGNRLTTLDVQNNQRLLIVGCNYNQMDKDALETLYRQLPDISNITDLSELSWPEGFRMLRANGNPGFYEADKSIAEKKGWEFVDKWVYTGRRRLASGGGRQ